MKGPRSDDPFYLATVQENYDPKKTKQAKVMPEEPGDAEQNIAGFPNDSKIFFQKNRSIYIISFFS